MVWKKTGRVQNVSALFCNRVDISPVLKRLQSGPKPYRDIEFAQGDDWHVIFGKSYNSEEILLPHIPQADPLFQAFPEIWMRVGTCFNLPSKVQSGYIEQMRLDNNLSRQELVILPQFLSGADLTNKADIFVIEQRVPVSQLSVETVA